MLKKNKLLSLLRNLRYYILSFGGLLIISILLENYYLNLSYNKKDIDRFSRKIAAIGELQQKGFSSMEEYIGKESQDKSLFEIFPGDFFDRYKKKGLSFFLYKDSALNFWSENVIPVPDSISGIPDDQLVRFGNSLFLARSKAFDNFLVYGLILIKTEHPYVNRMLKNGYRKEFRLGDDVEILAGDKNLNPVTDKEGNYLFSLDFAKAKKNPSVLKIIISILYGLTLLAFLVLLRKIQRDASPGSKNTMFLFSALFLPLLFLISHKLQLPGIIYQLDVFTILTIQNPLFSPPIGDLFLVVIIGFFIIYSFYIDFQFPIKKFGSKYYSFVVVTLFLTVSTGLYLLNNAIIKFLVLNTSISFETFKVLDISFFTFMSFMVLAITFAAYAIWTDKLLSIYQHRNEKKLALWFVVIMSLCIAILGFLPWKLFLSYESTLFYILVCFALYYFRFVSKVRYRLSSFIFFVLLFSIFTVVEVTRYSNEKNVSQMKMMAVSLSTEHDPVAELLFVDLERNILKDEEIIELLYQDDFDFSQLYSTVQRKYFSGFWDKYDLQITVCGNEDSVFVAPPVDDWYPCYPFFYENIMSEGVMVPNTGVFFLDNLNGRISYFLALSFNAGTPHEATMFLELDSRLVMEGLGYPSLLLDESLQPAGREFSYAKYFRGDLITSVGEFDYSTRSNIYTNNTEGFETFTFDKFDHIAYHLDKDNIILVSKPALFWIDILISFSYIFSFYFLNLFILLVISRISPVKLTLRPSFKTRIQLGMNSVLFFSFILIGAGTVYFSINQYRTKQYEILEEKVQSVYIELIHKLEFEDDLKDWSSESYFDLNELLQKFSNVFYTDINLFDSHGIILASSRPEIFNMGLLSNRMEANAFKEMSVKMRSEFVQREVVGNLKYLSVYVPFVNADNKLLAYLNLPYFTRQDALTREITNLVVAIINIVVLLSLLGFTIAVFMANTVTMPLNLIQQKLRGISLSEKNEHILYNRNDEIGSLVKEYNHMVSQLQKGAELLAKSERESAWREMAKQIAHEIKNPLTPMKLNIQHLQRTVKEDPKGIEAQVSRISEMLIEQIENLSSIATEFSNFAKMPQAKNEVLDLEKELKKSIELFNDYDRCILSLKIEARNKLEVFADREQISRVFINLLKNAIQAVPENAQGQIEVGLRKNENMAIISIKDNGKGIPEDIRGRLFHPNFTTKTSGMGLGLAIVRNIVQNAGGDIYFETELDKGSTFYVELPLVKPQNS